MWKPHPPVTVLLLTTLLGACGPEELEAPQDEEVSGLELEFAEEELSYASGGAWSAPNAATPLESTSDRACFFTRLGGALNSGGDSLRIAALRGRWHVDGTGSTNAKAGCARLRGRSDYTTGYDWRAGQAGPTHLGSSRGRVCFLTRVGGSFNAAEDWIGVYEQGGSWFLSGASQARNGYARARCVTVNSYSSEYSWAQGARNATYLGRTGNKVCALTYMAGQFDGDSEFVQISKGAGHWYLSGSSARSGIAAKARCF